MYILMEIGKSNDDKPVWDTSNMGRAQASPMASPLMPTQQPLVTQFSPNVPRTMPMQGAMSPTMPSMQSTVTSSMRSTGMSSMTQSAPRRAAVPTSQNSEIAVQEDNGSMTEWLGRALQTFNPAKPPEEKTQTLVVQSREGIILQSSDNAVPHAEQRTIIFHRARHEERSGYQVIRARLEERSGQPRILVESASGVPLACLDTSSAISRNGMFTQKSRRVNIHRVPLLGPAFSFTTERPYASVVRVATGVFVVTNNTAPVYLDDIRDARNVAGFILLVKADAAGNIQEMRDSTNDVVVRQESVGFAKRNLWMRHGCDVSLVVSVALAVQKLGD
jgi:hypothetical protein